MSNAVIVNTVPVLTRKVYTEDYPKLVKIKYNPTTTKIKQTLPFRIKFMAVGIEGSGSGNVLPIPLQVIGYSNYIL